MERAAVAEAGILGVCWVESAGVSAIPPCVEVCWVDVSSPIAVLWYEFLPFSIIGCLFGCYCLYVADCVYSLIGCLAIRESAERGEEGSCPRRCLIPVGLRRMRILDTPCNRYGEGRDFGIRLLYPAPRLEESH